MKVCTRSAGTRLRERISRVRGADLHLRAVTFASTCVSRLRAAGGPVVEQRTDCDKRPHGWHELDPLWSPQLVDDSFRPTGNEGCNSAAWDKAESLVVGSRQARGPTTLESLRHPFRTSRDAHAWLVSRVQRFGEPIFANDKPLAGLGLALSIIVLAVRCWWEFCCGAGSSRAAGHRTNQTANATGHSTRPRKLRSTPDSTDS